MPTKTVKDDLAEESDCVHEMNKLKKEVERLLCENSALRKELARVTNKQSPDENEAGLCVTVSCNVLSVETKALAQLLVQLHSVLQLRTPSNFDIVQNRNIS